MSGLAFARAPPASHPLRFLLCALAWGLVAGAWLLVHGAGLLLSRWAPATLAAMHLLVLGVLGNAMLGSLLQFLPVAAGSPFPQRGVPLLHAAFNAGLACLPPLFFPSMAGTLAGTLLAASATAFLAGALAGFALLALRALLRGSGECLVRIGIALALAALLVTVALGVALLLMRCGWIAPAAWPLVDVHAGCGVLGWILGLVAAVGAVAMPMLQGTRAVPVAARAGWLVLLAATLGVVAAAAAGLVPAAATRIAAVAPALFAATALWLQACAPHERGGLLRRFWQAGCVALLAGAGIAAWPGGWPWPVARPLLVGALVLGIALPLLVMGMLLEITGFVLWIDLRARVPRGMRIPGVGALVEAEDKRRALAAHAVAAVLLLAAVAQPALARAAGVAWLAAYAVTAHAVARSVWRARRSAGSGSRGSATPLPAARR